MSVIRTVLSWIIIFVDRITRPSPMERSPDEQEVVENELEKMSVYQFEG
jgi:hypothetical protein